MRPLAVYLHGIPGSGAELQLPPGLSLESVWTPDRIVDAPALPFSAYLDHLENSVRNHIVDGPIHLIGFSLGARMAIEMGVRLGERVSTIDLVSPAAPLECGVDLGKMAGGTVFGIARKAPLCFAHLTQFQSVIARRLPSLLYRMIFASAQGKDLDLASEQQFQQILLSILRSSFSGHTNGYAREILAYVMPWADRVALVKSPVTLWHGSADNWSPPMMSDWLAKTLPNVAAHNRMNGQSHYSTLKTALPQILA
jgi:pimeloyl-ACP methyl ester carboxylesterase